MGLMARLMHLMFVCGAALGSLTVVGQPFLDGGKEAPSTAIGS